MIEKAYYEFSADTDEYLEKAIDLFGEYVWGIYDLLCLPPSFPYGGMENPCLTFITPTLLAGDRSLTSVVAHEIAHRSLSPPFLLLPPLPLPLLSFFSSSPFLLPPRIHSSPSSPFPFPLSHLPFPSFFDMQLLLAPFPHRRISICVPFFLCYQGGIYYYYLVIVLPH